MTVLFSFCLQAKHEVKNKDQLLALIQKYPQGMAVTELKDAYLNVMDDLQVIPFPLIFPCTNVSAFKHYCVLQDVSRGHFTPSGSLKIK